jgi:hypothetical protein
MHLRVRGRMYEDGIHWSPRNLRGGYVSLLPFFLVDWVTRHVGVWELTHLLSVCAKGQVD